MVVRLGEHSRLLLACAFSRVSGLRGQPRADAQERSHRCEVPDENGSCPRRPHRCVCKSRIGRCCFSLAREQYPDVFHIGRADIGVIAEYRSLGCGIRRAFSKLDIFRCPLATLGKQCDFLARKPPEMIGEPICNLRGSGPRTISGVSPAKFTGICSVRNWHLILAMWLR